MSSSSYKEHIQATKELLDFCAKYDYEHPDLVQIKNCLENLKKNNIGEAKNNYRNVSIGGMGTFVDWSHDSKVINDNFSSLVKRWSEIMYKQV